VNDKKTSKERHSSTRLFGGKTRDEIPYPLLF
jgi:hypothetical protein